MSGPDKASVVADSDRCGRHRFGTERSERGHRPGAGRTARSWSSKAEPTIGGGVRSAELTLPGFVHDICSAVHPFAVASPFLRTLPLADVRPRVDRAARDARRIRSTMGPPALRVPIARADRRRRWGEDERRLSRPDAAGGRALARGSSESCLGRSSGRGIPSPRAVRTAGAALGRQALRRARSEDERTRALFAGIAAHGMLPLDRMLTAGFGLVAGRHVPRGRLADAARRRAEHRRCAWLRTCDRLAARSSPVRQSTSIDELPPARAILCDLSPKPLLRIAGHRLPARYRRKLERYRYGMGVFKVDWALDGADSLARRSMPARRHAASWRNARARSRDRRAAPGEASIADAAVRHSWSSRRCSIRRARRPASIWRGRTATCRTRRPST